jgi:hypothetical protein
MSASFGDILEGGFEFDSRDFICGRLVRHGAKTVADCCKAATRAGWRLLWKHCVIATGGTVSELYANTCLENSF